MCILVELSHIHCSLPKIIELVQKYVPYKGTKVTLQDLTKFIYSQSLAIDPNTIMVILNN